MSLQEKEIKIKEIELELLKLKDDQEIDHTLQIQDLENTKAKLEAEAYRNISAYDRVYLARKADRPNVYEYIENLFDDFIELHGDRLYKDDGSMAGKSNTTYITSQYWLSAGASDIWVPSDASTAQLIFTINDTDTLYVTRVQVNKGYKVTPWSSLQ